MDFQHLVSFFLFISFLFLLIQKWRKPKNRLPPGPWRLPIIGSVHHLTSGLPHQVLKKLSFKYGPIMYLQLGEVPTVVVSSSHMAKQILKTHDLAFASRPETMMGKIICYNCKDIAFSPYGDYWRHMRKLTVLELLSAKMVKSFSPIRQDELSNLLSSIRSMNLDSPINLVEKLLWFMNAATCRSAFGNVCKDQRELITLIHQAQSLSGGFELADLFPSKKYLHGISGMESKLMNARYKIDQVLDNIINVHRENRANGKSCNGESGAEDLIDVFLRVMESGQFPVPLTNDNIKAVILDMFVAGSDTSSSTVIWALSELMRNPNIMAKAQAEVREVMGKKTCDDDIDTDLENVSYLMLVIKETLRLHPPTPLLVPRECREETKIDEFTIPLKSKVMVNVWAIGRDPENWENPECFVPERFENSSIEFTGNHFEFLPFGAGRRICPGIQFGLALVTLPLAHLLYNFDWKLPQGISASDLDMTEANGISARREKDLYLIATPYVSPLH
ncbi:premnaspirodiene oxygenase-like [Solanum lycopersicum]|uniref:premnaspirodiene oxygenase-like n=1 Tax=Solanum lycopersicum TaxID=4081 RepID=UPI000276B81D|nr:premnaspirodiene oxygenase-like [Solanum lycopersicum]